MMNQKLVADAGSTKIDWAILNISTTEIKRINSMGINALTSSDALITNILQQISAEVPDSNSVDEIFFYGAGCSTPDLCQRIRTFLCSRFATKSEDVHVESDLLGATRSLLGDTPGIACILGTGSNSCQFDGSKITEHTPSMGFILGDEGSGARLGCRLVSDAFKGHLPSAICREFENEFNLSIDNVLDNVYRQPAPNKYLASFVPFIKKHIYNPYIYAIVLQEFQSFLIRNVSLYSHALSTTINFTGSIACHFADILRKACDTQNMTPGKISNSPIEGLIDFHFNHHE